MSIKLIEKPTGIFLLDDRFELLPNALIVHDKPSEEEFDEAFRRLFAIESATSWRYGDLANAHQVPAPDGRTGIRWSPWQRGLSGTVQSLVSLFWTASPTPALFFLLLLGLIELPVDVIFPKK